MNKDAGAPRGTTVGHETRSRAVFYAAAGPVLTCYEVDIESAALTARGSVTFPAPVQYAWQHASQPYLYAASSNGGPDGNGGMPRSSTNDWHFLSAFRIDPATGELTEHGAPVSLPHRPIHMTTDIPSAHVLVAYSRPGAMSVHRINGDGTIGQEVAQSPSIDFGIYPHQARVASSNQTVLLVARGHDATSDTAEEPGSLKQFRFRNGLLVDEVSIAPAGGYGFGPRHLDFHPSLPLVYVSLERQHQIWVFGFEGESLSAEPLFKVDTLARPKVHPKQMAGTLRVHPNGRVVYGSERVNSVNETDPAIGGVAGEDSIVVYAINPRSGEPTLIQRVETRGRHPRTFSIDPTGRLLIAANKSLVEVQGAAGKTIIPACLDVYRIADDGRLSFVHKVDIEVGDASMFWTGFGSTLLRSKNQA